MRKIVNGFVRANGRIIENNDGEILLKGFGIGNWLLCEGYMWQHQGSPRMDRPHRIEQVVRELIGEQKSKVFWKKFRENYFTKEDVQYLKEMGHNSIRIPINWTLFLEDEPNVIFKNEGFDILDACIAWCREADMYVWIDMHGAPGGQTGANIDDCIDDMPRLFMDADKFEKGLVLWEEIAKRFKDEETVAGYDLLNEPIRPERGEEVPNCDYLVPELIRFYKEAIKRIRKIDRNHLIALEGHHWSTTTAIFNQKYDDNFCIHFHRYWDFPTEELFSAFLEKSKEWNVPLWLGETGENSNEWFSAVSQICDKYGISYHFWPYKKMGAHNCSATIKTPEDWDEIIAYTKRKSHPGYETAEKILNEFLDNMLLKNCHKNSEVDRAILRNDEYNLCAVDFAETEGSYKGNANSVNVFGFKTNSGLSFVMKTNDNETYKSILGWNFSKGRRWDMLNLVLEEGEFVSYYAPNFNATKVEIHFKAEKDSIITFAEKEITINESNNVVVLLEKPEIKLLKLACLKGKAEIDSIRFL